MLADNIHLEMSCKSLVLSSYEDELEWQSRHDSMCHAIQKAAKVALAKDVNKVQKYTMSGVQTISQSGCL